MNFLRWHWFDIGLVLAVGIGVFLLIARPTGLSLLLWLSLITLFLHQFEEYRYPGYFPGMVNSSLFSSTQPDRYPLNAQTSLLVNVIIGWLSYALAALLNQHALWLGIATLVISLGNTIAHMVFFNLKGKTIYNPGMVTSILLFLPIVVLFFTEVIQSHAASPLDWVLGILLGIALNYLGIIKLIDWMKDERTPYIFPARFMLPSQRKRAD